MKKYIPKTCMMAVAVAVMAGCTPEQEVIAPMDPTTKAKITITRTDDHGSSIDEGDTLKFNISTNKMIEYSVDFSAAFADAAGIDQRDYVMLGGELQPYTTETTLWLITTADNFPELSEALEFDVNAPTWGQNWQLSPESEIEQVNVQLLSHNLEDVVTIGLDWPDDHNDLDMYIYSVEYGDDWGGFQAAGSNWPEISTALWPSDPDGTYYVGIDPYHLEGNSTPYSIHVGLEDGSVQIFEGVFNIDDADQYEVDNGAYRLLQIVLAGGQITVTKVAP